MRTHFLQSVLGLTALGAALVACGDDGSGSGGGGGSGSGTEAVGPTTGANPNATAVTGTGVVATGTQSGPVAQSSSSGLSACEGLSPFMDGFINDAAVNECVQDACCEELRGCGDPEAGDMACFNADGEFDTSLSAANALNTCMYASGCFGAVICDSGIGFGDDPDPETLELTGCLSENCCEEFNECVAFDGTGAACIDCLNGDADNFDVCTPANDCSIENCEVSLIFVPICESGLGSSDPESATCANDFCCEEYTDCTDGGSDAQACIDCLVDGGGALCDAALACEEENCNPSICDSGLAVPGDLELAACLNDNCCAEYTACTGGDPKDEDAVNACLDCIIEALESGDDPGALCADAVQCELDNCSGEGGGGTGGGGAGGGGTGGAGGGAG